MYTNITHRDKSLSIKGVKILSPDSILIGLLILKKKVTYFKNTKTQKCTR